jgi:hypothetical protein
MTQVFWEHLPGGITCTRWGGSRLEPTDQATQRRLLERWMGGLER